MSRFMLILSASLEGLGHLLADLVAAWSDRWADANV